MRDFRRRASITKSTYLSSISSYVEKCGFRRERKQWQQPTGVLNLGDSRQVRNIKGAIWDAYEVARSI